MRQKRQIIKIIIVLLISLMIWPQYSALGRRGIADVVEEDIAPMGGEDTPASKEPAEPPPADNLPKTPKTVEISEEIPGQDEFYPGTTLSQVTDEKTENTTDLVRMPDGTVKLLERDKSGRIISEREFSAEEAAKFLTEKEGVTTKIKKHPDGSTEICQYDENGDLISSRSLDQIEMDKVVNFDDKTGLTTTVERNDDGSYTLTKTDADGVLVSRKTLSPEEQQADSATSFDPHTGITTTSVENADGTRSVIQSRSWKDSDGSTRTVETDDKGNRTETVTTADGITTITKTYPEGLTTEITKFSDGTIRSIDRGPDGSIAETTSTPDGTVFRVAKDHDGNIVGSMTQYSNGTATIKDVEKGTTTEISGASEDGSRTYTTTDRRGNQTVVVRDGQGNIKSQEEIRATPMEPGEEYFRTVLGGDDWENVPQSLKTKYAGSERQMRESGEMQALRDRQAAERQAQADADAEWRAQQQEQLEARLAQIDQEYSQERQAVRQQQERDDQRRELEFQRMEAQRQARELQGQLDVALQNGDKQEIRRIENLMDEHHDRTAHLFEFTDQERAQAEQYQEVRDQVEHEIVRTAMDRRFGLKHDLRGTTTEDIARRKYEMEAAHEGVGINIARELTFTGAMVEQVEDSIYQQREIGIRANNKVIAAQEYLNRTDLTPQQRQAAEQILEAALAERYNAATSIAADAQVILWGTIADVGTGAVGGTVSRAAGRFLPRLAPGLSQATKVPPIPRPFSREAAESVSSHPPAAAETPHGTPKGPTGTSIMEPEGAIPRQSSGAAEVPAAEDPFRPVTPEEQQALKNMTPEERQAWHDERAQRQAAEAWRRGAPAEDGGPASDLVPAKDEVPPPPPEEPGSYTENLTQEQIDELFRQNTGETILPPEQIVQKADAIRTGQAPQSPSNLPEGAVSPGAPAGSGGISQEGTIINEPGKASGAAAEHSPHSTTIMDSPEAVADEAFRGQETSVMTQSGQAPASTLDGDYAIDLTTPEGIKELDARIEQAAAERQRMRAAGESPVGNPDHLFEPPLFERPGFKELPTHNPPEIPMGEYLTPEEAARADAETVSTPAVKPAAPSPTEKFPEVEMPDGAEANPVRETLDAVADESMRVGPGDTQVLPPSEAAGGRTPPESSAEAPKTKTESKPPAAESEPEIQLLDDQGRPMSESRLKQLERQGRELDAALKQRYKSEKMPPMHVCDGEAMAKIEGDGLLKTDGISFSPEGIGPLRRGGEAIRVKPELVDKQIHFIKGDAKGWAVKYFKDGIKYLQDGKTVDLSKGSDNIPLECLERFNKETGKWVGFE